MRVVLVEDHPAMRLGLATAFEIDPQIQLAGEAESAEQALDLARAESPGVVVLDLRIKGRMGGIELCRELKSLADPPKVVVYTAYNAEEDVLASRLSGADSYVHKGEEPGKVLEAIRETHAGKRVWLMGHQEDETSSRIDTLSSENGLTPREKEVFSLMARRYTNAEIASELSISPQTTKNHASTVLGKLGVERRTDLP